MFHTKRALLAEYFFKMICYSYLYRPLSVPTVDTIRTTWLLEQMVKVKRPVVLVGESGTSKTATTQNFLNSLNPDTTVSHAYVFHYAVFLKCQTITFETFFCIPDGSDYQFLIENHIHGSTEEPGSQR